MTQTTKDTRLDYVTNLAKIADNGFNFIRAFANSASDYQDLFAAELTNSDFVGTSLEGIDVSDIQMSMVGFSSINDLLDANGGQLRKAFKRVAQFSR